MLDYLLSGTNCVSFLPTGYGESLPYQMYILLLRMIHDRIVVLPDFILLTDKDANHMICI